MLGAYLHSFIIAKVLGLWMIVLSLVMIGKPGYIRSLVKGFDNEKTAHFMFASMLTFLGLVLICFHNYWVSNLLLLVTVACWLILIKGILWLAFPECMIRVSQKMVDSPWYWVGAIISLIYGVLLLSYAAHFLTVYEFVPTP